MTNKKAIDDEIKAHPVVKEIPNLRFRYIDLGEKTSSQKKQLKGKLTTIFNDHIAHPSAAIDTLLLLFPNLQQVLIKDVLHIQIEVKEFHPIGSSNALRF